MIEESKGISKAIADDIQKETGCTEEYRNNIEKRINSICNQNYYTAAKYGYKEGFRSAVESLKLAYEEGVVKQMNEEDEFNRAANIRRQ